MTKNIDSCSKLALFINLKQISKYFGVHTTCFLIKKLSRLVKSSSDIWEKAKSILAGNLNLGPNYLITNNCITTE